MTKLTQKKVKFEWGDKQEAAFQLFKQKLCSAPILALPEESEDFIAYCDASKKGLGAVLMQREKNDRNKSCNTCGWNPVPQWQELVTCLWVLRTVIMHESPTKQNTLSSELLTKLQDMRGSYIGAQHEADIATYVSKCLTCAKVNAEHQRPSGFLVQPKKP
ncbi:putative reverse transcriptase domain-containing protein [Tanacetum coccineum]